MIEVNPTSYIMLAAGAGAALAAEKQLYQHHAHWSFPVLFVTVLAIVSFLTWFCRRKS
jgi:hypothetical protein